MIRRSLRIGIRLGMLAGLAFAVFKIVQARKPLPALPSGADPWAPPARPAPEPGTGPERSSERGAGPEEPRLVQPTMLQGTSLRRPSSRPDDEPFDPASTAPTLVPPFTEPAAGPTSAPTGPSGEELEADDDEIVILETEEVVALVGDEPAEAPAPEAPAPPAPRAAKKAAAAKAPAKKAAAKKAAAKKAAAAKAPAKKAAAKKAAAKKAAAKKPATKSAAQKQSGAGAWVEPDGSVCPTSHPVKAKLRSAIYHLPGMAAYARTVPDRCYRDEDAAVGDGLRKAAR